MEFRGKMAAYVAGRLAGLEPRAAGAAAGYNSAGAAATISRLEARADIKEVLQGKGIDRPREAAPDKWAMKAKYANPLELMLDVMNNPDAPKSLRYQAAKDALPFCHPRKEGGKKDNEKEESKGAAEEGPYKRRKPPSRTRTVN